MPAGLVWNRWLSGNYSDSWRKTGISIHCWWESKMTQIYIEDNMLIFIKITNTFINKVWDVYITEYYITLKEDEQLFVQ